MLDDARIIGRYAPSPTGDLHLGNLRTALLAWLHTRLQHGTFLMRMEDLDTPRVVAGSADRILRDLDWLGLDWDGEVIYQSQRTECYQAALDELSSQGLTYQCFCSRRDIQQAASAPHGSTGIYPGTCTSLSADEVAIRRRQKNPAIRLRVGQELGETSGDFVIKRADGLFAYQLAVVVDDLAQEVTDVVRGADLIDCAARQQYLANRLQPQRLRIKYLHAPLMLDEAGQRMSKRDGSLSVAECRAQGRSSEQLVGELAAGLQLIRPNSALSASDLLSTISLHDVQRILF